MRAKIVAEKTTRGTYRMRIGADYPQETREHGTRAAVIQDAIAMYSNNTWQLEQDDHGDWSIEIAD